MKYRPGFTIVEVIVVITAIAILASIGAVTYTGLQRQARADERIADMEVMASYLETYYEEKGNYPSLLTFYYGAELGDPSKTFVQKYGVPRSALLDPAHQGAEAPHYSYRGPGASAGSHTQAATWPSTGIYTFLPYRSDGAICTTPNDDWAPQDTNPCTRYTLFYKDDSGALQEVSSKYGN